MGPVDKSRSRGTQVVGPEVGAQTSARVTRPLGSPRGRLRYVVVAGVLAVLALTLVVTTLAWDNPMPFGSEGFWLIAGLRVKNLLVIALVAVCHATATVAFQTVTHNRILTPSIMGFEALYTLIQTGIVFLFGAAGLVAVNGTAQFVLQAVVMVVFAVILYSWLLSGRHGDLQTTLLIGLVVGGGLAATSTFMQRLLTPSEFDVLTASLIGSIASAQTDYLGIALPVCAVAAVAVFMLSGRLNLLGLGPEVATNLGMHYKRNLLLVLALVSVLMALSTALVGPFTFFGFLVAMIAYQLADTYDHRLIFPMAWLTGFVVLGGAHFTLKNIFYAQGSVGIIIELVGGTFFLAYILKRGRL